MTAISKTDTEGFVVQDFEVFHIPGLEERMAAIQTRIRPKFQLVGDALAKELTILSGNEMYLHIAKHARRTVNPPKDTWLAICNNKRGYKAHPHFQLGLFDDHLFIWLALIYEVPNKKNIATNFIEHLDDIQSFVPDDFVISQDHMNKAATAVSDLEEQDWEKIMTRFRDVGKAELLIGRHLHIDDPVVSHAEELTQFAFDTYKQLFPIYKLAMQA